MSERRIFQYIRDIEWALKFGSLSTYRTLNANIISFATLHL